MVMPLGYDYTLGEDLLTEEITQTQERVDNLKPKTGDLLATILSLSFSN